MDSFLIRDASGAGALEFFDRTPPDVRLPIARYRVRLTDLDLSAVAWVYAGYGDPPIPTPLFAQMAVTWRGWPGELVWHSLEGEFRLRCAQDRTGHVSLRVALSSGPCDDDWTVESTVMTEAGQLEGIARRAELFFGEWG